MPGKITTLVLGDGLAPAVTGAAAGLLASWGLIILISALLFGGKRVRSIYLYCHGTAADRRGHFGVLHSGAGATRVNPVAALRYE